MRSERDTAPASPGGASATHRHLVIEGQSYSREEIIHRYLPLVKYVAGRILTGLPRTFEIGDLINDGVIGLIDAIGRFDEERGLKFDTYAVCRIRGAILDAVRGLDPVSRPARQRGKEIARAKDSLNIELGRHATSDEIAQHVGLSVEKVRQAELKVLAGVSVSIDDPLKTEVRDTLRAQDDAVDVAVEKRELQGTLSKALDELPHVERFVLKSHYFGTETLSQVALNLGLSPARVSQIHAQAVRRLHKRLGALRTDFGYGDAEPAGPRKYMRGVNVRPLARASGVRDSARTKSAA
jgi:RNA polymerase sigma factor for flagellar operon FliA